MISYDDLVVALAAWRSRQGLPVVQVAGSVAPRPAPTPARTTPPGAPPRPVAHEPQDFEESALIEESPYEADDYVVESGEATAIGGAPEPATDGVLGPRRGKRPDW